MQHALLSTTSSANLCTAKRSRSLAIKSQSLKRTYDSGRIGQRYGALNSLCHVLQSMSPEMRRKSILSMSVPVRQALVHFKESGSERQRFDSKRKSHCQMPRWGRADVRPTKNTYGRTYTAHLDLDCLRIYTNGHRDFRVASMHQSILSSIRDKIGHASDDVWDDSGNVHDVVQAALSEHGTSEQQIGLRAFVQMRAERYVPRKYVISSPVMSLSEALAVRSHLLDKRLESWESFRHEWVQLMCCTRNARKKRMSSSDAGAIADKARQEFLEQQFSRCVYHVEAASNIKCAQQESLEESLKVHSDR